MSRGRSICLVLASASCGLLGCVERKLTVTSEPEGAIVYLNDQEIGRTPVTRDFTWYGNYDVRLRREGYETLRTTEFVVAPWWQWVPFDLLAEVSPFRWQDHERMSFTMRPASEQPISADVMLDRAGEMRAQLQSSPNTRLPTTRPATTAPTTVPSTAPTAGAS